MVSALLSHHLDLWLVKLPLSLVPSGPPHLACSCLVPFLQLPVHTRQPPGVSCPSNPAFPLAASTGSVHLLGRGVHFGLCATLGQRRPLGSDFVMMVSWGRGRGVRGKWWREWWRIPGTRGRGGPKRLRPWRWDPCRDSHPEPDVLALVFTLIWLLGNCPLEG